MKGANIKARSAARLAVVQALYQMEATGAGVETVIAEFGAHRLGGDVDGVALYDADTDFFESVLRGVVETQGRIDPYIERHLADNWSLKRLDATARAILRSAIYELIRLMEIPERVVIDEYIDIAKAFFEDEAEPKFINGLLDAAARDARGGLGKAS
ncbi:MAG: transcription antitermination factor NusB [Pseudomonadota bacterium]